MTKCKDPLATETCCMKSEPAARGESKKSCQEKYAANFPPVERSWTTGPSLFQERPLPAFRKLRVRRQHPEDSTRTSYVTITWEIRPAESSRGKYASTDMRLSCRLDAGASLVDRQNGRPGRSGTQSAGRRRTTTLGRRRGVCGRNPRMPAGNVTRNAPTTYRIQLGPGRRSGPDGIGSSQTAGAVVPASSCLMRYVWELPSDE